MKYVCNTFTLSMLHLPEAGEEKDYLLRIKNIADKNEIKEHLEKSQSAVGHQGTVDLINTLFGTNIPLNRVEIKLDKGDELLVSQLMVRLPEGKVLSKEEMEDLYKTGKVKFLLLKVL
ncbi:MAG: DUF1874 domain-containing protein [Candidatus Omnitrophica bacterium]|nr:DUF1874 domain-containing protein [Candidatus Omnitrophota bacterium]